MNKKIKKWLLAVQRLQACYACDVYMVVTAHLDKESDTSLVQVYAASDFAAEDDTISLWFTDDKTDAELNQLYNQLEMHLDYLCRCKYNTIKEAV